jgi:hypothetical protein
MDGQDCQKRRTCDHATTCLIHSRKASLRSSHGLFGLVQPRLQHDVEELSTVCVCVCVCVAVKTMLQQLGSMRFADDENNLAQILFLPTPISIGVSAESLRIIQHNNHGWPVEGCAWSTQEDRNCLCT